MKLNNKNIICTVSSGYSSAMMALKIKEWYPDHNIIFCFANTGKENVKSIAFLEAFDLTFNLGIKYLEAVINPQRRKGTKHKELRFGEVLSDGKTFEEGIKKYGIPSVANKWCTRELKNRVIKSYGDSVFGKKNYSIAIGLRADEINRISAEYQSNNVFYPLVENNITSNDRNKFWSETGEELGLKLDIPAYEGNCEGCFEKSNRKNLTHIKKDPSILDWYILMQNRYSKVKIEGKTQYNEMIDKYGGAYFFRGNVTAEEMLEQSRGDFKPATDEYVYENDYLDKEDSCGGGCVIFNGDD